MSPEPTVINATRLSVSSHPIRVSAPGSLREDPVPPIDNPTVPKSIVSVVRTNGELKVTGFSRCVHESVPPVVDANTNPDVPGKAVGST